MNSDSKIKLIITDDNQRYIDALSIMVLKNKNFKIIDTCINGLELINNSNLSKANVLLIDIQMPVMNGLKATIQIYY